MRGFNGFYHQLASALVAVLPMVLFVCLRDGVGEGWYPTALMVFAPPLPLAAAIAATVFLGLRRRRRLVVALHVILAIAFTLAASGFVVPLQRSGGGTVGLRVLTYNAYRSTVGVAPLAALIHAERPDVVCLQEVGAGPRDRRRGWRDLRRELPAGWHLVRHGELAIATRLPVSAAAWHPLSRRMPPDWHHDRDALRATVRVAGQSIQIVTVHLSVPTAPWLLRSRAGGLYHWQSLRALREEQVEHLVAALDLLRGPRIVTGDLNSTPACRAYARLTARSVDTFAAAGQGWGYTFPAVCPLLRLDYILADPRIPVAASRVVRAEGSDHRPLITDFRLPLAPRPVTTGPPPGPASGAASSHGRRPLDGTWAHVKIEKVRGSQ